jgi:hypothetical protein
MKAHRLLGLSLLKLGLAWAAVALLGCPQIQENADAGGPAVIGASLTALNFNAVIIGTTSAEQHLTVGNIGAGTSGTPIVAISGPNASDFAISNNECATPLGPGANCVLSVTFTPTRAGSEATNLLISAMPGGNAAVTLVGIGATAAQIVVSPILQSFGSIPLSQTSSDVTFTVSNTGGALTGVISATVSGTNPSDFAIGTDNCTSTLAGGSSCALSIHFSPSIAGTESATLNVSAVPGGSVAASLNGSGSTASIGLSPSPFGFENEVVGETSSATTFTVTNSGNAATGIPMVTIGGTDATQFKLSTNACTAAMPAGGTCTVGVEFVPTAAGARSATLELTANPGGAATAAITGTAVSNAVIGISPGFQSFGQVQASQTSSPASFTVTNNGGVSTGALTATFAGTNASEFSVLSDSCQGSTLAPLALCSLSVVMDPKTLGAKTASLNVTGSPGGTATVSLSGAGVAPAALTISPSPENFGSIVTGTASSAVTLTVTNTGGTPTGSLTASLSGADANQFQIVAGGNGCQGATLGAGSSCAVAVTFSPSTSGSKAASLTALGSPGGSVSASLSGTALTPASLQLSPPSANFGSVGAGSSSSNVTFTVTNSGQVASSMPSVALGGTNASDFVIVSSGCTASVPPAGSCTVVLDFHPASAVGAESAQLSVNASSGGAVSSLLVGTSVTAAALGVSPTSQSYGTVAVGQASSAVTFTVIDNGASTTGPLTFALSDAKDFSIVTGAGAGTCVSGKTTLSGSETGSNCTINVNFTPQSGGPLTSNLNISASPGGSIAAALSGTGLSCPTGTTLCGSLCVDTASDSGNCGACAKVCPSGDTCTQSACVPLTVLTSTQVDAVYIAVDNNNAYWTTYGTQANNYTDGQILKAPLGGGTPVVLVSGQEAPWGIATDPGQENLYWVNSGTAANGGSVMSVSVGGGTIRTIATMQDAPDFVAVDATNVYWTNFATGSGDGKVMKEGIAGNQAPVVLASGLNGPTQLATDGKNVYWANSGTAANGYKDGSVAMVPIGGGTVIVLVPNQSDPFGIATTIAGTPSQTIVYWTNSGDGTVWGYEVTSQVSFQVASGQNVPNTIVVGGETGVLYWTNQGSGSVMSLSVLGESPAVVATNQTTLSGIAANLYQVTWVNAGTLASGAYVDGSVVVVNQ